MRWGLMIYGSLDLVTGGFIYDRLVVEYCRRQGDQVEVISLPWQSYGRCLAHNLQAGLARRLVQGGYDILVQDELIHPSLFWLNRRLRRQLSCPLVSLVHLLRSTEARPAWQNRLYRLVERQYLQSVDGFIFISRHTRDLVEQVAGRGRPYTIAYSAGDRLGGLDEADITAKVLAPGPRQILYLGAVIRRKGLDLLLQALAALPEVDWQLTVAGSLDADPAYARRIYRLISQLHLSSRLRLLGVLQGPELVQVLRRSHILAMPSFIEGLALVYLEGMSFGLVPLAATQGAAGEVITPGQDGFLIPPGDVSALRGALQTLCTDQERLLAMSLAARQRLRRHPTWEETAATIREFLLRLAATGKS